MDNGLNLLFDAVETIAPKEEYNPNDENTIIDKQYYYESGLEKDSNAFIQSIIKDADETIPDYIQNYSSLMQIKEDIFDSILKKIEMDKANKSGNYDNIIIDIFKDLEEEYYKAKKELGSFYTIFSCTIK